MSICMAKRRLHSLRDFMTSYGNMKSTSSILHQFSSKTAPASTARFFARPIRIGLDLAVFSRHKRSRRKFARNSPGNRGKITQQNGKRSRSKATLAILQGPNIKKPEPEKIAVRTISDKGTGAAINPDPNSPLLIIGDSHTLVFHDFLAEKSGLLDQLAYETGFAPDLIGTRGSGATSVRVTLYRRARKDPDYLAKKKVIVWCFAAREFTESDQGWDKVPVGQ